MTRLIGPDLITISHKGAEDASGVAAVTEYTVVGYFEAKRGMIRTEIGHTSSNSMVAVIEPEDYKITWDVVRGDRLLCRSSSVEVLGVFEAWNPRTGELHHIEADCG